MKCADCQNIKRHKQANQSLYRASVGFSGCAKQPAYVYFGRMVERDCADFVKVVAA